MNIDLKKWMQNIDDNANPFAINLVGTHDCATQFVQYSHITKCQDLSITEQLNIGVRALDIRVQTLGDRLGLVHGIAKCYVSDEQNAKQMDMADVLKQCYSFLDENPSEAIILMFKNDSGKEMERCFNNLFYSYIKGNEDRWYLQNKIPSMAQARGKIVLIRRCRMDMNNKDFTQHNTGIDFSRWVEQDKAVPDALMLDTMSIDNAKFIIQDRFKYKPEPRWSECIKPFLDARNKFDGEYIICYLSTAGGVQGPKANSRFINPRFVAYPLERERYYGIIFTDFPTADICKKVIKTNAGFYQNI